MIGRSPCCWSGDAAPLSQTPPALFTVDSSIKLTQRNQNAQNHTTISVICHNSFLLWVFKNSQFKRTHILWRTALHAKNGNGIAQGGEKEKKKTTTQNSKKSLTHPLLFIRFWEQRMECRQAKIDSAIFWSLSDVNPSQGHTCWENFSLQNSKNDS